MQRRRTCSMNEICPCRISENAQVFDLQISDEVMDSIDALSQDKRVDLDPNHIDFDVISHLYT